MRIFEDFDSTVYLQMNEKEWSRIRQILKEQIKGVGIEKAD